MKTFIMATLYVCLTNGQCEQKQIKIEDCKPQQHNAEVPVNGEWTKAKVGIKC